MTCRWSQWRQIFYTCHWMCQLRRSSSQQSWPIGAPLVWELLVEELLLLVQRARRTCKVVQPQNTDTYNTAALLQGVHPCRTGGLPCNAAAQSCCRSSTASPGCCCGCGGDEALPAAHPGPGPWASGPDAELRYRLGIPSGAAVALRRERTHLASQACVVSAMHLAIVL